MTSPQLDPAFLQNYGATPDEARARFRAEMDALHTHLLTRQPDWTQPQPGREWSPAQEAEHILLINQSVMPLFGLLTSDKELRPSQQIQGQLKDGKRQAPPYTLPSAEGLAWDEWQTRWAEHLMALETAAQVVRQTPGRTFWHPFFGELDALDWLRMLASHAHGHRRNLERSIQERSTQP